MRDTLTRPHEHGECGPRQKVLRRRGGRREDGEGVSTGRMGWMAHRKWKEAKQLPDTAGPGNMLVCCLISFHFLWAIHPVYVI